MAGGRDGARGSGEDTRVLGEWSQASLGWRICECWGSEDIRALDGEAIPTAGSVGGANNINERVSITAVSDEELLNVTLVTVFLFMNWGDFRISLSRVKPGTNTDLKGLKDIVPTNKTLKYRMTQKISFLKSY